MKYNDFKQRSAARINKNNQQSTRDEARDQRNKKSDCISKYVFKYVRTYIWSDDREAFFSVSLSVSFVCSVLSLLFGVLF